MLSENRAERNQMEFFYLDSFVPEGIYRCQLRHEI